MENVPGIPGFRVYRADLWLPRFYRPDWLATFTFHQGLNRARRLLFDKGCKNIVLYLWDFRHAPALSHEPHDLTCYHIDDEYSFSTVETPLDPEEVRVRVPVDGPSVPGIEALCGFPPRPGRDSVAATSW